MSISTLQRYTEDVEKNIGGTEDKKAYCKTVRTAVAPLIDLTKSVNEMIDMLEKREKDFVTPSATKSSSTSGVPLLKAMGELALSNKMVPAPTFMCTVFSCFLHQSFLSTLRIELLLH